MTTVSAATMRGAPHGSSIGSCLGSRWKSAPGWHPGFIGSRRELCLNWLALGLLLAAWNVSNDDSASRVQPRPASLRGYTFVSVRAASLHAAQLGAAPLN
jgi:hypothetical protein